MRVMITVIIAGLFLSKFAATFTWSPRRNYAVMSSLQVVSVKWQSTDVPGHYGGHPRPQVADRGTPSSMDKRVAPDKEGSADKQCLGE